MVQDIHQVSASRFCSIDVEQPGFSNQFSENIYGEFTPLDAGCYQYEKENHSRYCNFILRKGKIVGSIIIGYKSLSVKVKQAIKNEMDFSQELYDGSESIIQKLLKEV